MQSPPIPISSVATQPILSICIATLNRGSVIAQTLDSIVCQLDSRVQVLILDGASTDNTRDIVQSYVARSPAIKYHRQEVNSGIDKDYDIAVSLSDGQYCWLMTDDDLLMPGAIDRVLGAIQTGPDLVVINAQIRTADLSTMLQRRRLPIKSDMTLADGDATRLFELAADYLSFIGGVVMRKSTWLERDRSPYFGTLFIHVGVIFQSPKLRLVTLLHEPLITIRYGNAMWTPRGFEIWMFKWPKLIWSFAAYSDEAKRAVCPAEPWRRSATLLAMRANGAYSIVEYKKFLQQQAPGFRRGLAHLIAILPARAVNIVAIGFWLLFSRRVGTGIYDIARSRHAGWLGRWCETRFLSCRDLTASR